MATQCIEKLPISTRVPSKSKDQQPAKPLFVRAHVFLFSYSAHLGVRLQLAQVGRNICADV